MALAPKQAKFAKMVALLVLYIEECGYHVTFGDTWARDGHKDCSCHYKRLAVDLKLFPSRWKYLSKTSDFLVFGEFWESIGGTWGGRFTNIKDGDGNHFSLGEK